MKHKPIKKMALLSGCILLTILLIIQYFQKDRVVSAENIQPDAKTPDIISGELLQIEPAEGQQAEEIQVELDNIHKQAHITIPNPKGDFAMEQVKCSTPYAKKITYKTAGKNTNLTIELTGRCRYTKEIIDNKLYLHFEEIPENGQVIVLDAGHGGSDVGAEREQIYEKDINLSIVRQVREILEKEGYAVILTREEDSFLSVEERADFVNSLQPTIFVSVHCNDSEEKSVNGTEVFYNVEDTREKGSQWLAQILCDSVIEQVGTRNRGIKDGKDIHIVRTSQVPVALIELGFLSGNKDFKLLSGEKTQKKYAQGIAAGIIKALKEQ